MKRIAGKFTLHFTLYIVSSVTWFFLSSCYYEETPPIDSNVWEVAHPSEVKLDASLLIQMHHRLQSYSNKNNISSVVIIKDNKLVYESYYGKSSQDSLHSIGQVSSILSNVALGFAIEGGLIMSADDSIYKYLPEYAQFFEGTPLKKSITFAHLMSMKSGLAWIEFVGIEETDINKMMATNDWVKYIIERSLDVVPGHRYSPNSGIAMVLAACIKNKYGGTYKEFLLQEVFANMNISRLEIQPAGANDENVAWGISVSSLDLAKIGYLYLKKGNWFGRRLINEDYVISSTSVQSQINHLNNLGWLWWRYAESNFFFKNPFKENDVYFSGMGEGNLLCIIPHLDMVIVITGDDFREKTNLLDFTEISASLLLREFILSSTL